MKDKKTYAVVLFKAVSYALKAEKILKQEGLPHKLIPVRWVFVPTSHNSPIWIESMRR